MTKLVILSPKERRRFDSPPRFKEAERSIHFALTKDIMEIIDALRTSTNKVGFFAAAWLFQSKW